MLRTPTTVTAPATDPITPDDAAEMVGAESGALETQLRDAVLMARAAVEAATGVRLINQTVEVLADRFADLERLNVAPVRAIVSLKYRDATGVERVLDASVYELFGSGIDRGIRPAIGASWPMVDGRGGGITARLDVGFGTDGAAIPDQLRWAMLLLVRAGIDGETVDVAHLLYDWRIAG